MAGEIHYAKPSYFKKYLTKPWHGGAYVLAFGGVVYGINRYYQNLAELRYNTYRGRTSLYGDDYRFAGKFINKTEE